MVKDAIKKTREAKQISVRDLAAKSDVSAAMIYKIESGEVENPGIETIGKLANGLGVSIHDLIDSDFQGTSEQP